MITEVYNNVVPLARCTEVSTCIHTHVEFRLSADYLPNNISYLTFWYVSI